MSQPFSHCIRKRPALLCGLLAILLVTACAPREADEPETRRLVVGVENQLLNLDPMRTIEVFSLRVMAQIFEGLVALDGEGRVVPMLAERWESREGGAVWRLHIRQGVSFHPHSAFGEDETREVTAEDVRYSLTRLLSPESQSAWALADIIQGAAAWQAGEAEEITGLRVLEPHLLEVHLEFPEPHFLRYLTSPWFAVFPREIIELDPAEFGRSVTIGTGPFIVSERRDTRATLRRNPDHWRAAPGNVEELVFQVIANEQIRLTELRNGNIGVMGLPHQLLAGIAEPSGNEFVMSRRWARDFSITRSETFNIHFLGFNADRLDQPLRKAIHLALDRGSLAKAAASGIAIPTHSPFPAGLHGHRPVTDVLESSPGRIARLLAESHFNPEQGDVLEILVHELESADIIGELAQSQLRAVGIPTRIRQMEFNAAIGQVIQGDVDSFVLSFEYPFSTISPILQHFFSPDKIPVPNFWRYDNPEVTAGLRELRRHADEEALIRAAQALEAEILADPPAAFLFQKSHLFLHRSEFSGLGVNGHSMPDYASVSMP